MTTLETIPKPATVSIYHGLDLTPAAIMRSIIHRTASIAANVNVPDADLLLPADISSRSSPYPIPLMTITFGEPLPRVITIVLLAPLPQAPNFSSFHAGRAPYASAKRDPKTVVRITAQSW
jgi:hypothetical protein